MKTKKGRLLTTGVGLFVLLLSYHGWTSHVLNTAETTFSDQKLTDSLRFTEEEYGFDRLIETDDWWLETEEKAAKVLDGQLFDTVNVQDWQERLNAIRLVKNPGRLWPLHPKQKIRLLRPENLVSNSFLSYLSLQMPFSNELYSEATFSRKMDCEEEEIFVCLLDKAVYTHFLKGEEVLLKLRQLAILHPMIILYYGGHIPEELLTWPVTLLQLPAKDALSQAMAAQVIVGANDLIAPDGELLAARRLGRVPAEAMGMNTGKLQEIDRWVEKAIRRKVIPGCQVLVVKSGKIVYDKAFGFHTYNKERPVSVDDVYDIASITKAAATTLGVMKLVEDGRVALSGRIRDYIPDYRHTSFSYLRVRHLLSHQTGLQGNLPIAQFLNRDDLFRSQPSDSFSVALNKNFYIKNGLRARLLEEVRKVRVPRRSFFRYSDVNFILLQQLIEHQSGQSLDRYVRQSLYDPLGLQYLQYLPGLTLMKDKILPTEKDKKWRKHLVHGEVHDESAILLGGVAGHAGLFSNAGDLAILFQMLINGGTYAGERFFEAETVAQFIAKNNYNYRAYGFDRLAGHSKNLRRYGASLKTFGHTGFTGGCVWADPDNDLIFVFLSNRIYPSKRNNKLQKTGLRERLHKIVYQSLSKGAV